MAPKQALIFSASSISGWAIVKECLTYPSKNTFSGVIALSKNRLEKTEFLLPEEDVERLDIHDGIDLTQGVDIVIEDLRKIPAVEPTTHVYYAGKPKSNPFPYHFFIVGETPNISLLIKSSLFSLHRPQMQFSDL